MKSKLNNAVLIGLNTPNKLRIFCILEKKVNNISDSVKKVSMKIKEMARSVFHFALNIFSQLLLCMDVNASSF
jgi:DNA-binding transcriptional ArsR family regulator